MSARKKAILKEIIWREECRNDLVQYAKTIPIPGVPQADNYEQMLELGEIKPEGEYREDGTFEEWDDGRYNKDIIIPLIETSLAEHHVLMLEVAQKVITGTLKAPDGSICRRAMFFMPPGSAKSTYIDVVIPTWAMGRKLGEEIILTSYADMLSKRHGKRARQVCLSHEYQAIFATSIQKDTRAADNWALGTGSSYLAAGIHSGLTGNRSGGLIWDDLVKGYRAAQSETERESTWTAYRDDARTRKKPNAWELGIMTRWHEDDPPGRILPQGWAGESGFIEGRDGYWWYVGCLQAEVETDSDPLGRKLGDFLWPDWFNEDGDPAKYWEPFKLDAQSWSSLYQQVPTPPEGTFFKETWKRYYDHLPQQLNYFVSADYATSEENTADYSSIGLWGVDSEGVCYFIQGWHGRADPAAWIEIAIDFIGLKGAIAHIAGKGTIRRMSEGPLKVRMRKRNTYTELVWYEESYEKKVNAKPFAMMMAAGMVLWPRENEEAEWVLRHLLGFGTLKIDDPVDMCSMFGRHMARIWGPAKPREDAPPPIITPGVVRFADVMRRRKAK